MGRRDPMIFKEQRVRFFAEQWLDQGQERGESRITIGVDHVTETGQGALRAERLVERARRAVAFGGHQQLVGLLTGTAVKGTHIVAIPDTRAS